MACNIASRLAGKKNIPVALSSLEMSSREIINRLLAIDSGVDGHEIRDALYLSDDNLAEVTKAAGRVANHLTWIDPTAGLDALSLRNRVKRWKASIDKPGLLIVDYLQLIAPSKKHGSREQEVAHTSRMLKSISMDLEIPVLALSQFSRKVDSRDDPEPKLSDLRESGAIEQDASVVLFLYRPDPNDDYLKDQYKLKIAKNRHGGRGEIGLTFRPHCLEFVETARDAEPPGNYQDEKDRNELPF
jgi:replicative DNA helicase